MDCVLFKFLYNLNRWWLFKKLFILSRAIFNIWTGRRIWLTKLINETLMNHDKRKSVVIIYINFCILIFYFYYNYTLALLMYICCRLVSLLLHFRQYWQHIADKQHTSESFLTLRQIFSMNAYQVQDWLNFKYSSILTYTHLNNFNLIIKHFLMLIILWFPCRSFVLANICCCCCFFHHS